MKKLRKSISISIGFFMYSSVKQLVLDDQFCPEMESKGTPIQIAYMESSRSCFTLGSPSYCFPVLSSELWAVLGATIHNAWSQKSFRAGAGVNDPTRYREGGLLLNVHLCKLLP